MTDNLTKKELEFVKDFLKSAENLIDDICLLEGYIIGCLCANNPFNVDYFISTEFDCSKIDDITVLKFADIIKSKILIKLHNLLYSSSIVEDEDHEKTYNSLFVKTNDDAANFAQGFLITYSMKNLEEALFAEINYSIIELVAYNIDTNNDYDSTFLRWAKQILDDPIDSILTSVASLFSIRDNIISKDNHDSLSGQIAYNNDTFH